MQTIAIMQPYLFPYLGYFQLIAAVDIFILYDNLAYIKYGWVNRNRLLAVNRAPFYFIVPVHRKSSSTKIRDITIQPGPWKQNLLNSIYFNYKRSTYFAEVFPVLEHILHSETDSLSTLNKASIVHISKYLGIDTYIVADPNFDWLEELLQDSDLSRVFPNIHLHIPSVKVTRAIAMCKSLDAQTFINPIGGIHLYPREEFKRHNIHIQFLNMRDVCYQQRSPRFHARLSIIDVLMNCGKKGTLELLSEFVLV